MQTDKFRKFQSYLWFIAIIIMTIYGFFILITEYKTEHFFLILFFSLFSNWLAQQCILHRYFTHKVIKVRKSLELLFHLIATTASVESSYRYRALHLAHHRYADTENDVHGPRRGFFAMHKLLLSHTNHYKYEIKNNFEKFFHNHYYTILFCFLIILMCISIKVAAFYCLTVYVWLFLTDMYNYTNHKSGFPGNYRNFNTKDNSHNNMFTDWWTGTYHNNHHANPSNITDQVKWFEFDPIFWFFIKPLQICKITK